MLKRRVSSDRHRRRSWYCEGWGAPSAAEVALQAYALRDDTRLASKLASEARSRAWYGVIHADMAKEIPAWPQLQGNVLTCGDVASRYTRYVPGSALSLQFR